MGPLEQPWAALWVPSRDIGDGGQGLVHEVQEKGGSERRAILKRLKDKWKNDSTAIERLRQEGAILRKLNSVGADVPEIYDHFESHEGAEPFLLMEYIAGERFDQWIKRSSPVALDVAIRVTAAVAATIAKCHEQGIGHRDLKPANIILRDGDSAKPCVIDFGISFDARQTVGLTKEGEIFFNEFLRLPECQDLEGDDRDHRSDIAALAGILFTCLTGRVPAVLLNARGLAPHVARRKELEAATASPRQLERLLWLFDKSLAYKPADRISTLKEFLDRLARVQSVDSGPQLSLDDQFARVTSALRAVDRPVQLGALRPKFMEAREKIRIKMRKALQRFAEKSAHVEVAEFHSSSVRNWSTATGVPVGEVLLGTDLEIFRIAPADFGSSAVAIMMGVAVGMDVELHLAATTCPVESLQKMRLPLQWELIATIREAETGIAGQALEAVAQAVESALSTQLGLLIATRQVSS